MLRPRPGPGVPDVFICTYECTWCRDCAENVLRGVCPNCGGELVRRPIRPARLLAADPPSTRRVLRPGCAPASSPPRAGRLGGRPVFHCRPDALPASARDP